MDATANAVSTTRRSRPRPASPDPRPVIEPGEDGWYLIGGRCTNCGHASATSAPRCPRCGSHVTAATFGPAGVVWSVTTIHVAHGERTEPYTLAYVDLTDGPRLLVHMVDGPAVAIGGQVRLRERSRLGDPQAEAIQ